MYEAVTDWELVDMMGEATRQESMSIAERYAMIAELYERRKEPLKECEWWFADHCAAVAAEVSAALNISHARAVGQVQYACALKYRLPRVLKVFLRGTIDIRVVSAIVSRTENVAPAVMPALDEAIARHAEKWMRLSEQKVRDHVDQWVARFDPDGVRVPPDVDAQRYFEFEPARQAGMAYGSAHMRAEDAAALDQRLDAMAAGVCANDPRTMRQRRADAAGALARGDALACRCGSDDCPAKAQRDTASSAVIHVLAEQSTVDGISDDPGYLPGFGILPAASVRGLAESATVHPLEMPTVATPADPGYRPSARTKRFLRFRDVTCRWPGCDRPADQADIDHTVPYPYGPTHPSNNKHYCRIHHLIKTFYSFIGWRDEQSDDGTMLLLSPSGHINCTQAHGAALFPALARSTGELDLVPRTEDPGVDRTVKMPRRKRTREQARRDRINAERRQRAQLLAEERVAEEQRQREAWRTATYEPPPF